jgi:hypothetical protein
MADTLKGFYTQDSEHREYVVELLRADDGELRLAVGCRTTRKSPEGFGFSSVRLPFDPAMAEWLGDAVAAAARAADDAEPIIYQGDRRS